MTIEVINPAGWPRPKGYANGIVATGRTLYIAGMVGWDTSEQITGATLPDQFAQALDNVLAVVTAAGGEPSHVVRMTVYVTDLDAYRSGTKAIGAAYKARFGKHFPAMALVGVAGLVERGAMVEIEATAVLPEVTG